MKGVIFTEFMELVEHQFGLEELDALIEESAVPSGGIYTAVGTYPHTEMVALVVTLSKRKSIPTDDLLELFGQHLFKRFTVLYPELFNHVTGLFEFLISVENYIHVEVLKLYPDAELPSFVSELVHPTKLKMDYHSDKSMGMLAVGLIKGAMNFFNNNGTISITPKKSDNHVQTIVIELFPNE